MKNYGLGSVRHRPTAWAVMRVPMWAQNIPSIHEDRKQLNPRSTLLAATLNDRLAETLKITERNRSHLWRQQHVVMLTVRQSDNSGSERPGQRGQLTP